jgi:hypothetical protein
MPVLSVPDIRYKKPPAKVVTPKTRVLEIVIFLYDVFNI